MSKVDNKARGKTFERWFNQQLALLGLKGVRNEWFNRKLEEVNKLDISIDPEHTEHFKDFGFQLTIISKRNGGPKSIPIEKLITMSGVSKPILVVKLMEIRGKRYILKNLLTMMPLGALFEILQELNFYRTKYNDEYKYNKSGEA